VRRRTHEGQTAWHAAAAPSNRSFVVAGNVFPYTSRAAACCNQFVMSLSQLPSKASDPTRPATGLNEPKDSTP
jgi:hypothetical protein